MVKRRDKTGRRPILQLESSRQPTSGRPPIRGITQYSDSDDEERPLQGEPEQSVTSATEIEIKIPSCSLDSQVADFLKEIDALTSEEQTSEAEAKQLSESPPVTSPMQQNDESNCVPEESHPVADQNENGLKNSSNDKCTLSVLSASSSVPSTSSMVSASSATSKLSSTSKLSTLSKSTASKSTASSVLPSESSTSASSATDQDSHGLYSVWQQCQDENTGYTYFWNMETNQVTWECPPEYTAYLEALQKATDNDNHSVVNQSPSSSDDKLNFKKSKSKKKTAEVGRIIPISYFEPSSSSSGDSSDEDSESMLKSKKVVKLPSSKSRTIPSSSKSTNLTKDTSEVKLQIGPQLPSNYNIFEDVPSTIAPSSSSETDNCYDNSDNFSTVIGPQLPSYYIPKEAKSKDGNSASSSFDKDTENDANSVDTNNSIEDILETKLDSQCDEIPTSNEIVTSEIPSATNEEEQINADSCVIIPNMCEDEEPDSTTKRDSAADPQVSNGLSKQQCDNGQALMRNIVQYEESSEDEMTEMPVPNESSTKRNFIDQIFGIAQNGRFGFGFDTKQEESDQDKRNFTKSISRKRKQLSTDSQYAKINFVKSEEVLDLNKLNEPVKEEQISENEDLDIDEIDRALDLALEKKVLEAPCQMDVSAGTSKDNGNSAHESNSKRLKKDEGDTKTPKSTSVMNDIQEMSTLVMEKLAFLDSSHTTTSTLVNMLIQIQTRLADWREGALQSEYLLSRLQEAHSFLRQYENSAMPAGWTCLWDRQHKRYFYMNESTRQSQWEYPTEVTNMLAVRGVDSQSWSNHMGNDTSLSTTSLTPKATSAQHPLVSSSIPEVQSHVNSAIFNHRIRQKYATGSWTSQISTASAWTGGHPASSRNRSPSPPPPPPGVDSPPLPPPLPKSPPPPPPDSTELEEGEIPDVEMDIEDSNSSGSSCAKTNSPKPQPSQLESVSKSVVSPQLSPDHSRSKRSGIVSSSTSTNASDQSVVIAKPPQPANAVSSVNSNESSTSTFGGGYSSSWMQPVASTSYTVPSSCTNFPSAVVPSTSENVNKEPIAGTSTSSDIPVTVVKKEKKKTKLSSGLALKKKNIPSLVQKWQKIKKQQQREDNNSDGEGKISTSM